MAVASDSMEGANKPRFDDLMLAMDAVDTVRHEASVLENELSGDERREALKVRLREYYAGQGIEVSEEILETAVADMNKNRFVHEPLKPGLAKFLAAAYVRRGRYAKRTALAAAAVAAVWVSVSAGHEQFIVKPRERAAVELKADLETRLPLALKEAHAQAVAAAQEYGDEAAVAVADNQRSAVETLIAARDAKGAREGVSRLNELGRGLREKIAVAGMMKEAESLVDAAKAKGFGGEAAAAMVPLAERLKDSAAGGDEQAFSRAKADLSAFVKRVETPLDLRIVDREGTRSGVWRTNDNGRTRVYYIVVEALDPAGKAVPMDIKSVETGRTERVSHWGVRVPQRTYDAVGRDKQADGIVDDRVAGSKPAGSLAFSWSLPVENGHMITSW